MFSMVHFFADVKSPVHGSKCLSPVCKCSAPQMLAIWTKLKLYNMYSSELPFDNFSKKPVISTLFVLAILTLSLIISTSRLFPFKMIDLIPFTFEQEGFYKTEPQNENILIRTKHFPPFLHFFFQSFYLFTKRQFFSFQIEKKKKL